MTAPTSAAIAPPPQRFHREHRSVEVLGTQVAVRRAGSGPVVLYLHGHWLARRWLPFHDALAARVDLVAPDLPGFGDSARPAWLTGREDVVLVLRALVDALTGDGAGPGGADGGRVHVVGHGLGGWLAADLAVWAPERVASLTLLAPFGLRVPGDPLANVFLMNPDEYVERYFGGDDGYPDLVPGTGTPAAPGGVEEYAQRYGDMGTAAALMWERRYDLKLEQRLPAIVAGRVPTLVVDAAADRIVPASHAARWAELLGARRATVADAGHALVVTRPEPTAEAVAQFVEEVAR